jgi:predicted dienelactone hydrolase
MASIAGRGDDGLSASGAGASTLEAPFDLPSPTGKQPVGTTGWRLTDQRRPETFSESGAKREVGVLAWYPAAADKGRRAPYLTWGPTEVQRFAMLLRGERTAFDSLAEVRTHSAIDVEPASRPRRLPLLVFSHGYGSMPSAHAALLEDLASHGYVVLSIMHPYESGAAVLADGRIVSFVDANGQLRQGYRDVIGEWGKEDETMAAVTAASDEEEQRRLLRGYLSGLRNTDQALRRWVDDTAFVLDRLSTLPPRSVAGRLIARLDTERIGVFGHSMGGVTAGQFCVEDQRCVAGLNLDGIPQYGTMIDRPFGRPFLMVYSARTGRRGASDSIYRRAASEYYRVDVEGTLHLDFSDMIFWGGPLRERKALGTLTAERATEITRAIVRQYFDQTLRAQPSPLLAGKSSYAEVTVKALRP